MPAYGVAGGDASNDQPEKELVGYAGPNGELTIIGLDLTTILAIATVIHLILIAAEVMTPHATAHAKLAVREMVLGQYRLAFAAGWILPILGLSGAPPPAAAILILLGLFAYEHAHVGAGQAVPLA